jgi:hypothetical protein
MSFQKEAASPMDEREQHIGTTEARQGTTPHMTRYILGISLALVVIIFGLLLLVWK